MITKQQVEEQFRAELRNLLESWSVNASWKASIDLTDVGLNWPDERITVEIPTIYNVDGDVIREYTSIDLGRYFGP